MTSLLPPLPRVCLCYRHETSINTLTPDTDATLTPFYINYGVLISTPKLLKEFYSHQIRIRHIVDSLVDPWWGAQISLALSCEYLSIPNRELAMRFNYPNDPVADAKYPIEMNSIVFLHYLRTCFFDRHKIFTTKENFDSFLSLQLEGSNKKFQEHVA